MKPLGKFVILFVLSSFFGSAAQDKLSEDGLNICGQWFWLGMSGDEVLRKMPDRCAFSKHGELILVDSKRDGSSWRIFLKDGKVHELAKSTALFGGSEGYEIGKVIADAISAASPYCTSRRFYGTSSSETNGSCSSVDIHDYYTTELRSTNYCHLFR